MQRQAWLFAATWQGTLSSVDLHSVLHAAAAHLFCWSDNSAGSYPHRPMLFDLYRVLTCLCCDTALSVLPLSCNSKHDKKILLIFPLLLFWLKLCWKFGTRFQKPIKPLSTVVYSQFPCRKCYWQQPSSQDVVKLSWNRMRCEPAELVCDSDTSSVMI